jgi:hypothetical protein
MAGFIPGLDFYFGLSLLFPALSSKNATGGKTHGAVSIKEGYFFIINLPSPGIFRRLISLEAWSKVL